MEEACDCRRKPNHRGICVDLFAQARLLACVLRADCKSDETRPQAIPLTPEHYDLYKSSAQVQVFRTPLDLIEPRSRWAAY